MYISNEYILTLSALEGFGAATIKNIANYIAGASFNSIGLDDLYDILEEMLDAQLIKGSAKKNFPDKEALRKANMQAILALEKSDSLGIKMVSQYDPAFPANLLATVDEYGKAAVPMYLFYKGDLSITRKPAVAIIGTREPTHEGIAAGEYIASAFANRGFNIVSGLAIGCDTSGHRGALSVPGGVTTAFLAHGLDSVYPPENTRLADCIVANGGLLMSEYTLGMGVNRYNLVARDRLQAALADATIVVQTGIHGGTMHAVNATIAAGKPLYVVEYSKPIFSDKIQGNKYLKENKGAIGLSASSMKEAIANLSNSDDTAQSPVPDSSDSPGMDPVQLAFKFD